MTRRHPDARPPYGQPAAPANGRGRCRWCWGEVKPPRRTFCGRECVHEFSIERNWNYARAIVRRRDLGVCALCGRDTVWLQTVARQLGRLEWWRARDGPEIVHRFSTYRGRAERVRHERRFQHERITRWRGGSANRQAPGRPTISWPATSAVPTSWRTSGRSAGSATGS